MLPVCDPLLCNAWRLDLVLASRMGSGKFGGMFCRRLDFLLSTTPHHFCFVMQISSRLLRTARPCCNVKRYRLSLGLKATSRSTASFRRVPGLGGQKATSAAQPLDKAQPTRSQVTQLERKRDAARSGNGDFIYANGRKYDFFDFYLQKDVRPKTYIPSPSPWISSLNAEPENLAPKLKQDPLRVLDVATADPDLVRLCLQTFVARVHRDHGTGQEARQLYKTTKIGTRALLWFLGNAFEKVDLVLDNGWSQLLVHCLVGQGETHGVLHQWLTVDHTPKYAAGWDLKERSRWRAILFSLTMHSIVHWANGASTSLNDCLLFYDRAWNTHTTSNSIPKRKASQRLDSWLIAFDAGKVNVELFEKYLETRKVRSRGLRDSWNTASLQLKHPQGPRPEQALQLLLDLDANEQEFFQTEDGPFNHSIMTTILRTAQALESEGRTRDARCVLTIGRNRLPSYFANRGLPATKVNTQAVYRLFKGPVEAVTDRNQALLQFADAQRLLKMQSIQRQLFEQRGK